MIFQIIFLSHFLIINAANSFGWVQINSIGQSPSGRRSAASSCFGNDMYVFGGRGASARSNELWKYNYISNTWQQLPSAPFQGRSGSCMFIQSTRNKLWIFGGRNDPGIGSNTVYSFNLATFQWQFESALSNGPSGGRFGMSCFQRSETDMCIYGGQINNTMPGSSDAYCFNTDTNLWQALLFSGDFPGVRNDASDVDVGSLVYLIGGNGTMDDRLFILDTQTLRWQILPTPVARPSGRGDAVMGQINGAIFMQGGRDGEAGLLVDNYTWTLSGGIWTNKPSEPGVRWGASGCVLPQNPNVFVMFGGISTSSPLNDLWYYTIVPETTQSSNPTITTSTSTLIPTSTPSNVESIAIAAIILACLASCTLIILLITFYVSKQVKTVKDNTVTNV